MSNLQRAPALLILALAAVVALLTAALLLLGLHPLYAAAFALSFPVYYIVLTLLARAQRRAFAAEAARLLDSGADRFQPPHPDQAPALLRFWTPARDLHLDLIAVYRAHKRPDHALRHLRAALDLTPEPLRPLLAADHLDLLTDQTPVDQRIELLLIAEPAPDLPARYLELLAQLLLEHRRDHAEAQRLLLRALDAEAKDHGRRFKLLAQLALTAAAAGRFGAADGYLLEAEDAMPSGDPGYQAFLARAARKVDQIKKSQASAVVVLRQLIEGPEGSSNTPPDHLPEAPEDL